MKKNILNILIAGVAVLMFSCSEDRMDEINKNVNDPADVASSLIITDVMTSSALSVTSSDLAFYASCYVEHNVGVFGQMFTAETRTSGPTSSTTYNNTWGSIYANLLNLNIIINKCSEGGSEEGNFHNLGIAQILSAYNLAILTDVMGDVPWTEALQPGVIFTPELDTQEVIYTDIFGFLDAAIVNLGKETLFSSLGVQDFLFDGDDDSIADWMKFAYGLKARYTMRLSLKKANYNDVIDFADKSFTSAAGQCQFNYNGATSKSPFEQFYLDRNYFGSSTSLKNKLDERNDPRASKFFKKNKDADDLVFAPNGSPEENQKIYGISAISDIEAPTYFLSYHEIEFLKAEAYARNNDLVNAKLALEEAIVAACGKSNVGVSEADARSYYTDDIAPVLLDQNSTLKEIMIQKYIAFFEEEAVEAFNDIRRLKAMGDDFIVLESPLNATKFPLRFTYGSDDVTTNVNVREAYGDGSYVYTENVWWAGGSR